MNDNVNIIKQFTDKYFKEVYKDNLRARITEIYVLYKKWCRHNNYKPIIKKNLTEILLQLGYKKEKKGGQDKKGIKVRTGEGYKIYLKNNI